MSPSSSSTPCWPTPSATSGRPGPVRRRGPRRLLPGGLRCRRARDRLGGQPPDQPPAARGRQAQGSGSAAAITPDGFLVTSAHVVEGTAKGRASMADGREPRVPGRRKLDPLSDLAVIRASGADLEPVLLEVADRLRVGQLSAAVGNLMGLAGWVDGRGGQRARPVLPDQRRTGQPAGRERHPDRRRPAVAGSNSGAPGSTAVAAWSGSASTAVAGLGLGLAVPASTPPPGRQIIAAQMRERRFRRAFIGIAGGSRLLPPLVAQVLDIGPPGSRSSRWSTAAPPPVPACATRT